MSARITITICSGTHCFVMGASELLLLGDHLPADVMERVSIEGSTCLDLCRDPKNGRPPFVTINGSLLQEATLPAVIDRIMELANA